MSIGQPLPRPDGPAKVTGRAPLRGRSSVAPGILHAVLRRPPRSRPGASRRSTSTRRWPRRRGARAHASRPAAARRARRAAARADLHAACRATRFGTRASRWPSCSARRWRRREHGARLRRGRRYERDARFRCAPAGRRSIEVAVAPRKSGFVASSRPEFTKGDADAGLAARRDAHRGGLRPAVPPSQPDGAVGDRSPRWDGDQLTVYDADPARLWRAARPRQRSSASRSSNVRVIAPHTGGGFGGKGLGLAARDARRRRGQDRRTAGQARADPRQDVLQRRLSAAHGADDRARRRRERAACRRSSTTSSTSPAVLGRLRRVRDRGVEGRSTRRPSMRLRQRVERANVTMPTPMRAPVEGPGHLGAGERDGRARPPARHRSARPAACQLRRGRSGDGRAVVVEEAARGLRGRRPAVRLARAAARAAARRRLAGRPGHGELHAWARFRHPARRREVRLKADGDGGDRERHAGHRHGHAHHLSADRRRRARPARRSRSTLRDGRHAPARSRARPTARPRPWASARRCCARPQDVRTKLARLAELPPDEVEMADGRIRRTGPATVSPIADVHARGGHRA